MKTLLLARRALELLMVAFVVYVGLSIRPSGTAPEPASDRDIAPGLVSELEYGIRDRIRFGEFVYDGTRGRDVYRIRATEAVSFPAGGTDVFRLKDIVFESRLAATGRPITVTAPRAEFRRNSREMKAFDGVWIQSGELVLSAAIVVFEPEQNVLFSNGPVAAVLGELAGRAEAGSIDTRLGTVSLSGAVRVRGTARDGRYIDVAAPKVRIDRLGTLKAESGALVRSERFLLRATSVEERREGEGSRLAAQGHLTMLVPDEARGGPLKDSPIMAFGGSAELHRDPAGLPINGFLAALQPGGEELGDELMGFSRIDAAAPGGDGPRRLLSPRFDLLFQDGRLAEIAMPERLVADEATHRRLGVPGVLPARRLAAGTGKLRFGPSAATPGARSGVRLEVASFDGGVEAQEANRAFLKADQGLVLGVEDTAVFTGAAARPAEYRDETGTVKALSLRYRRRLEILEATGSVRASYTGEDGPRLPGGAPGVTSFSESEALLFESKSKTLALTGNVRAWQRDNVLRCAKLRFEKAKGALRAEGDVRAVFRSRRLPGAGKRPASTKSAVGTQETLNATGDVMTHSEAERLVRIEGNTAIVSDAWLLKADVTEIRLTPDRALESAQANGRVVLKDRAGTHEAKGSKATWRPDRNLITMEGDPATAEDGRGSRVTGKVLRLREAEDRIDVEPGEGQSSHAEIKPETR